MNAKLFYGVFILLIMSACRKDDKQDLVEIRLGAILNLTGDYSEEGQAGKTAIELSIDRLNQRYALTGSPLRFSCTFADTHMDTAITLSTAKDMYSAGIRLLAAGPNNSAELKAIKSFVNTNGMLTLCTFSSSPSLSIPGDYIFRLITDDNVQGQALVKMMEHDRIQALVPIWRGDTYGIGLYQTLKQMLRDQGVAVFPGVTYNPGATAYQKIIGEVAGQVQTAMTQFDSSRVAVILISYQEAVDFLSAADGNNVLSKIKWYGCDANVQKAVITSDPEAARFAWKVRFVAPIMGIGTADAGTAKAEELAGQIFNKTGLHPDAYVLSAFDAVQIYGLAVDWVQSYDVKLIRDALPWVCESYDYLGISRKLNAAGDLETANYIFWTVKPEQSGYFWDSYATYVASGDFIRLKGD
ncbi:MAG: ABC transporter substrate-binding protein [Bacteroidia bacterium]|nr:ABC transporter substrate-binding protein [Bacteroidia bacterium]